MSILHKHTGYICLVGLFIFFLTHFFSVHDQEFFVFSSPVSVFPYTVYPTLDYHGAHININR